MSKATPEQIAKLTELQSKLENLKIDNERHGYKIYALQILKDIDKESSFYLELEKVSIQRESVTYFIVKNAVEYYSSMKD